jgi:hypothetical protein
VSAWAGFGAAGYAAWRDVTAVARASCWVGRTAVTDQGAGQGGSRARSRGSGDDCGLWLNASPRSYLQEAHT